MPSDDVPSPKPVIDQVNLVVGDMAASAAFYERLGVTFRGSGDDEWAPHHRAGPSTGIDLDLDSERFAAVWDEGWTPESGRVVIGFKLASRDEVDRLYADLTAAGHRGQQPPWDTFFGARYAVVEDPDGNPVGLMSPIDPSRRWEQRPPG